jgi:hypothetical protein
MADLSRPVRKVDFHQRFKFVMSLLETSILYTAASYEVWSPESLVSRRFVGVVSM